MPANKPKNIYKNKRVEQPAFVTYTEPGQQKLAFAEYGKALNRIDLINRTGGYERTVGALANQYKNIDANSSIRSPFSRLDYEFFRPNEAIPRLQKQIIAACMTAYDKVGVVRNVIDLMGDFASQGIRIVHPNKSIERFYKSWFKQIKGKDRSERFLNHLYRTGNVIMKRNTAKLKDKNISEFKKTVAAEAPTELQVEDNPPPGPQTVPWTYTFINPMMVDVVGEDIAAFTGKSFYKIKIPQKMISMINNPRDQFELGMISAIPADILDAAKSDSKELKIGDDKLILYFYKKDDWQIWANPMLYAILDDLVTLEKMKMADLAALDGAISHIRIWKLGNLEHKILPTDAAVQKLADLLLNNVGGGAMDLIWGPDLEIAETSTDIHKFLGNAKYESVLISIYAGLGIPPTLTGASPEGGMTNNFVSLKTLIERLRYGRDKLVEFWENEIKIVQKAMGFKYPAQIMFDNMDLSDESSQLTLWVRLVEENLISEETMREKLKLLNDIEKSRLSREWKERESGDMPPKSGPYVDAEPDLSLKKIFAQRGAITPSEAGLELEEKDPQEQSMMDMQQEQKIAQIKQAKKGLSGQGRPTSSKDKVKRKAKSINPRTGKSKAFNDVDNEDREMFLSISMWAKSAQEEISKITNPFFLEQFGKSNGRQLTEDENAFAENFKFTLLYNMEPFTEVTAESVFEHTQSSLLTFEDIDNHLDILKSRFIQSREREPNQEEVKQFKSYLYAMYKYEEDVEDDENDNKT